MKDTRAVVEEIICCCCLGEGHGHGAPPFECSLLLGAIAIAMNGN